MNYESCIKPSASLLFYDWAHTPTVVTVAVEQPLIATIKLEEACVAGISPAKRRTPIVTVATSVVKRRPAATTSSRKEDNVTVRTFYIIAVNSVLGYPCPGTSIS